MAQIADLVARPLPPKPFWQRVLYKARRLSKIAAALGVAMAASDWLIKKYLPCFWVDVWSMVKSWLIVFGLF
jgi:hypothetical protein